MTSKPTSDAVAVTGAGTFERIVSHDEALEAAKDLIDGHFNNKGGRGVYISIPAQPDNTDVVLVDYIKQQRALSRLASTRPMTEDIAGLVDDFTSALRLGVEDDVTIPFDLAVRIHAALSAKPEAGESARHQPQREDVLEEAVAKALKHAASKIDEMMPPEQQSNGWKLGFCRMRKNAKDLLLGHARAYWASALEGGSAVGAGRLDHPLRHPAEAALTTPAPAVSRDDRQSAIAELCEGLREASDILARGVHAHHISPQGQLFLRCDASDLLTKLETLLSKHSPDAPGQHAGTRATESGEGDEA